jgi:hypothetical protein
MDNWPVHHPERVPLDYEFLTPSGMYYQGYIEGQKGRSLKNQDTDNLPPEFVSGVEDGYGEWIDSIGMYRGPIRAGVPFNFKELSPDDITKAYDYFTDGDVIHLVEKDHEDSHGHRYVWDPQKDDSDGNWVKDSSRSTGWRSL